MLWLKWKWQARTFQVATSTFYHQSDVSKCPFQSGFLKSKKCSIGCNTFQSKQQAAPTTRNKYILPRKPCPENTYYHLYIQIWFSKLSFYPRTLGYGFSRMSWQEDDIEWYNDSLIALGVLRSCRKCLCWLPQGVFTHAGFHHGLLMTVTSYLPGAMCKESKFTNKISKLKVGLHKLTWLKALGSAEFCHLYLPRLFLESQSSESCPLTICCRKPEQTCSVVLRDREENLGYLVQPSSALFDSGHVECLWCVLVWENAV